MGAVQALGRDQRAATGDEVTDSDQLLFEWYCWWFASSEAPVKMPAALHIRTALTLQAQGFDVVPTGSMETGLQQ